MENNYPKWLVELAIRIKDAREKVVAVNKPEPPEMLVQELKEVKPS